MKITSGSTYLTILREPSDPRISDESQLLHRIKCELNRHIRNRKRQFIKKRMWKDGHLVADTQQYLRTRDGEFCIYNHRYAIEDAGAEYNRFVPVTLAAIGNVGQHIKIGNRMVLDLAAQVGKIV